VYTNGPKAEALDISNPVDFATFNSLATAPGTSAAEEMARANPDARVVKAFNTTFARTLIADEMARQPLDVFIAGDDEQAKAQVAELVRGGGRWTQAHCGAPGSWRPSSSCT
jgi:8-hydroxy-5-deazaflavin:NADPH oxidoreductase